MNQVSLKTLASFYGFDLIELENKNQTTHFYGLLDRRSKRMVCSYENEAGVKRYLNTLSSVVKKKPTVRKRKPKP